CRDAAILVAPLVPYYYIPAVSFTLNQYTGHFPVADISPTDDVVVATLQTIKNAFERRHPQLNGFLDSSKGRLLVVFDEAHHSPAPSYRKLILALRDRCSDMYLLGLTATPTHSEEKRRPWLGKLFPDKILYEETPQRLMAEKILARPRPEDHRTGFSPEFDEREFRKWVDTNRDLPEEIISTLAENQERNDSIVDRYVQDRGKYTKTIIFADRWFQCDYMRERLRRRGVKADVVYSHIDEDPGNVEARNRRDRDENARVLAAFKRGDLDVLINVRMLTEGTDIPDVHSVFLTRQTTSSILLTQMVGRALRGPRAGGKPEAHIVSFIDNWKHLIHFAGFGEIPGGETPEEMQKYWKRPPLAYISIELVRRLARMMDTGITMSPVPYRTMLPIGWYRVEYTVRVHETDDTELKHDLVLVFESEREGFSSLIEALLSRGSLAAFEPEDASLSKLRPVVEGWQREFLPRASERFGGGVLESVFSIARHVAEAGTAPAFFEFAQRDHHDLDELARDFLNRSLDLRAIDGALRLEFNRSDRFWSTLYQRYDQLKSQFDACVNRLLRPEDPDAPIVSLMPADQPRGFLEPSEEVKAQVKERDGKRCLCCGSRVRLAIDHIVPRYYGSGNLLNDLQTLCKVCNEAKGLETIDFRDPQSDLTSPPAQLPQHPLPEGQRAGDTKAWDMFLRREISFFYRCGAVQNVLVEDRGTRLHEWQVELGAGNDPEWLAPHLGALLSRIRDARRDAKLIAPQRIMVWSPDRPSVTFDVDDGLTRELPPAQEELAVQSPSPVETLQEAEVQGDWFFNTNESWNPGSYTQMLKRSIIALAGFPDGEDLLNRPEPGDRVFAYVNGIGVIAMGTVSQRDACASDTLWQEENECHRSITWDAIVNKESAVPASEVKTWGFALPVRNTLCRLSSRRLADRLAEELASRKK
ncbi:MAG: DEAD/DEAH box helicase family protein, partial [Armatimonadetes bacterium]|nr:DEAD/DEAH box helicase family protein [Armatimonadota bacterium]